jgi:hypothetical protein
VAAVVITRLFSFYRSSTANASAKVAFETVYLTTDSTDKTDREIGRAHV